MIQEKDIELIEKYLSDSLTKEEERLFNKKRETDEKFAEEVLFRENLKVVSERIVTAEFRAMFNKIHNESVNKKRKTIYIYSTAVVSAAAMLLLFFFVGNPFGSRSTIENYIAEAGIPESFSIPNISGINLKSGEIVNQITYADVKVAFIPSGHANKDYGRYFFLGDVVYLFKHSDDTFNFFFEIDADGGRKYYLCRNKQLFSFNQLKDSTLYNLQTVNDNRLKNYCK